MYTSQASRDAALRRLRRVNRAMAAGSVLGAGAIMALIASTAKAEHHAAAVTPVVSRAGARLTRTSASRGETSARPGPHSLTAASAPSRPSGSSASLSGDAPVAASSASVSPASSPTPAPSSSSPVTSGPS